ncbi:MAG: hypothetical protein J1D77_06395 [Muribaculaceae bacterium]|nr:hypothetical protein [Muribaculaceae bacterium]
MKKLILTICISVLVAAPALADINGNGYYRVRNFGSQRWCSLIDNTGSVDKYSSSADLHSLELIADTEFILTDPGSIIYLTNIKGSEYDVAAQGVSLSSLVDNSIKIMAEGTVNGQKLYRIYGTYKGAAAYIGDGNTFLNENLGSAVIYEDVGLTASNQKYVQWEFLPVDVTSSDNFFGTLPEVEAAGESFTTLYTSFNYEPYSEGVKAFYISSVASGMVEMTEITGPVPAGAPVIIQCAGDNAADNKMQIVGSASSLPSNKLTGVYFNYHGVNRQNYVEYDPQTMRVLGVCEDGSLGFITSSTLEYIPANTAYLKVAAGSPAEYKCLDPETFTAGVDKIEIPTGILSYDGRKVTGAPGAHLSVVDLSGKTVAIGTGTVSLAHLPKGIYIARSQGESIKIVR